VALLECGRLRGRDTWAARKERAGGPHGEFGKAIGTVAYPLGDRRKAQVVGGRGGGGSGPGIPLGPGGALWELTPIQPSPQDCSNWIAHANGWGCTRQRLGFPFAMLTTRKLAKASIHHGRCSERFCRSRGLSNPQDRPQRSLQRRAAIECGVGRRARLSGGSGRQIAPVQSRRRLKGEGKLAKAPERSRHRVIGALPMPWWAARDASAGR
jgi:hypothetical protein